MKGREGSGRCPVRCFCCPFFCRASPAAPILPLVYFFAMPRSPSSSTVVTNRWGTMLLSTVAISVILLETEDVGINEGWSLAFG